MIMALVQPGVHRSHDHDRRGVPASAAGARALAGSVTGAGGSVTGAGGWWPASADAAAGPASTYCRSMRP